MHPLQGGPAPVQVMIDFGGKDGSPALRRQLLGIEDKEYMMGQVTMNSRMSTAKQQG